MKYMGSKRRIAKEILPIILKDRSADQWYVEPFVGGANTFERVNGLRLGGELNIYVASLLNKLTEGWLPPTEVSESEWRHVKDNKEKYEAHFVGFCGICLSFGSVWFCSYAKDAKGGRNYAQEAYRNLKKQAPKLSGAIIKCIDYRKSSIPVNSIIYCDPPYRGTDKFRGFEQIDHDIFWQWCRMKVKSGHRVFVSEFEAPEDFVCIWQMTIKTATAEKALGKNVTEKLFVHQSQL